MNKFKHILHSLTTLSKWNNRKIAFISILIATSVAFVVLFARILPITAVPTFKIAIGGLPIKLTGYIFGPFIGFLTGVLSDLLSFLMFPTFFHYWYTLAFGMAGFIPGVVGYIMNRRWKNKGQTPPKDLIKHNNGKFLVAIIVILIVAAGITTFILTRNDSELSKSMIKNKFAMLGIVVSGPASMLLFTIIARFALKPKTFNTMMPIIVFSVILDLVNTPLVTLGDMHSYSLNDDFMTLLTGHTLLTPLKSWGNLFIIYFSFIIVSPLIYNKTSNGWASDPEAAVKIHNEMEVGLAKIDQKNRKIIKDIKKGKYDNKKKL